MKQSEMFENAADTYEEAVRTNKTFDPAVGAEFKVQDTSKDPCEVERGLCDLPEIVDCIYFMNSNFNDYLNKNEIADFDEVEWQTEAWELRNMSNMVNGLPDSIEIDHLPNTYALNKDLRQSAKLGKHKLFYRINLQNVNLKDYLKFKDSLEAYAENIKVKFTSDIIDQYSIFEFVFDWSND